MEFAALTAKSLQIRDPSRRDTLRQSAKLRLIDRPGVRESWQLTRQITAWGLFAFWCNAPKRASERASWVQTWSWGHWSVGGSKVSAVSRSRTWSNITKRGYDAHNRFSNFLLCALSLPVHHGLHKSMIHWTQYFCWVGNNGGAVGVACLQLARGEVGGCLRVISHFHPLQLAAVFKNATDWRCQRAFAVLGGRAVDPFLLQSR